MSRFSNMLRRWGLLPLKGPSDVDREAAEAENVLWENTQAFELKRTTQQVGNSRANERLRKAATRDRDNNPFADLEDLINLRRSGHHTTGRGLQ